MKFMALADIHQSEKKWELLVDEVLSIRPDIVVIAGDLLPNVNGILGQLTFAPEFRIFAQIIKDTGADLVLIPGNDDNQLFIPQMEKGDKDGLWHYVSDRVKEVKGYEFCGCPWVKDHPFGYKYWVAAESPEDIFIDPVQISLPVVINENNKYETIPDLYQYLANKKSVLEALEKTAKQVKDISKSIWLIHGPPVNMGFDICSNGRCVGSPSVYNFLLEKQPLLSIHGHIHEAPDFNGNVWAKNLGETMCIQAGQLEDVIYYVTFDLIDKEITNLNHSVYGKYEN